MDLEGAIRPVVEASGLELFDLTFHQGSGRALLRVTVEREGGVDLDTIAQISERISRRLDVESFDPGPYALEVTSPGVERPLRGPRDFAGRVGERVKVKTAEPVDGTRSFTGTLVAAGDRVVRIATKQGERTLSFDDIASARTVADWEAELKERGKKR